MLSSCVFDQQAVRQTFCGLFNLESAHSGVARSANRSDPTRPQVIGVGVLSLPFSVSWLGWVAGIAMMLLFSWITQVCCAAC